MTIIRIPYIVLNVVNSVWIGLNLCSLLFRRVKQRKRRCSKKNKRIGRSDEEKLKRIEEVVGDTEEKRRRKKDEETRGRDPEYVSARPHGFTVAFRELIDSQNVKKKKKNISSQFQMFCILNLNTINLNKIGFLPLHFFHFLQ